MISSVPTRFDFDLDALITGVNFLANLLQQDLWCVLNTNRNATRDLVTCAAEMSPQRYAEFIRLEVPTGVFNRRLRHAMTTHRPHHGEHIGSAFELLPKDHGREKFTERGPGGLRPFIAVERSFAHGAFAPSFDTVAIGDASQNDATFSGATEAGFEEMNERQAYFAQFDRLDDQGVKMAPP